MFTWKWTLEAPKNLLLSILTKKRMERIYCKHETKYLRMRKRIHCNAIVALDIISPGPGEKLILTAWKKIND